ncbi:MAG: hypothetical protein QM724_12430 [Flavobacteriales bacterium]
MLRMLPSAAPAPPFRPRWRKGAAHTHTWPAIGRSAVLGLCLLLGAVRAQAQATDNPSDASTVLTYATTNGQTLASLSTPLPTSCASPYGTLNPASGNFTLSGNTSTGTTWVGNTAYPLALPKCGNYAASNDVWFRLDSKPWAGNNSNYSYRFTLLASGTAPDLLTGAMAVYEAPSAAGPFTLLDCAIGGSNTAALATLEVNDYTPASTASNPTGHYQLYLRVWDSGAPSSTKNFKLCVQGQKLTSMKPRNTGETPADAKLLTPSVYDTIRYAFAKEEANFLFADSAYVGGDLWQKLTVPSTGNLQVYMAQDGTSSYRTDYIAVSAYISPSGVPDFSKFRQVGAFVGIPPSTYTSVMVIKCLPPNATLYLRIHSVKAAQGTTRRYGNFRLYWEQVSGSTPVDDNNLPCNATPLTVNAGPCPPTAPYTGFTGNFGDCSTPGIPKPPCGNFSGSSRDVWYSFAAPSSGTVFIEATGGATFGADPAMALYTTGASPSDPTHGCNGRFTLIQCDERMGVGNSARIIRTGLEPGQTYYIRVWSESNTNDYQGTFTVCVSEPIPPAGSCFYLIDLHQTPYAGGDPVNPLSVQTMSVTINGDSTVYSTTPGEDGLWILAPIPIGANALFRYRHNSYVDKPYTWTLNRLGDAALLWRANGGMAVVGPSLPPSTTFTLTNACQLPRRTSDCLGARTVCAPNNVTQQSIDTIPTGNTYDLTGANMGCLNTEDKGIAWLIFRPIANGTVAFQFDWTSIDLDFAVWDAGAITYMPSMPNVNADYICAPPGAPVRCSSARVNAATGLTAQWAPGIPLPATQQEASGGWGWLAPLSVTADHAYLIAVVRGTTSGNVAYTLRWTLTVDPAGTTDNNLMGCTPLVLPVELLSLDATVRDRVIDVNWATASEHNSSHFVVERGRDAKEFFPIGVVSAMGEAQQRTDYLFTDEHPFPGPNYYRLRQVDHDGTFQLSAIVVAVMDARTGQPQLFPNPTTGQVDLLMDLPTSESLTVVVTDAVGRVVHSETTAAERGAFRYTMGLAELAPGPYQVQVLAPNGNPLGSARLMKQ